MARFRLNPWLTGGALALIFASASLLVRTNSREITSSLPLAPGATRQGESVAKTPCSLGTLPDAGICIPEPQSRPTPSPSAPSPSAPSLPPPSVQAP